MTPESAGAVAGDAPTIELLRDASSEDGALRVLIVTRMWPTERDMHRNGFLKMQVEALRDAGVSCDVLVAQGGRGPFAYAQIAHRVRRAVGSRAYDAAHAHYGLTGAAAGFQRSSPLVVTFHGSDVLGALDASGKLTPKGRFERILARVVCGRANATIAVSERLASQLPARDVITVPVGVDEEMFRPVDRAEARRKMGLDPDRRYVMFGANPKRPVKRYWLAREAVEAARQRFPDTELLVVCDREMSEMSTWMSAADVLLITSEFEGGPVIHREAMACNLPVVSVDVGDVGIHLRDVRQCFVVDDDPGALGDALATVLQSRERSDGRGHIRDLTPAAVAERLIAVYKRVAAAGA